MAIVKNDPFPGTDYNAYQSWQKVTLPSGQVVYVVPGNPGYVYDPVASQATGRKVFRANPQQAIDAQKKEQDRIDQASSPVGQLAPVVAGTAGAVGGAYLINNYAKGPATATGQVIGAGQPNAGGLIFNDGSIHMPNGQVITGGPAPVVPTTQAGAAAQGAVGTLPQPEVISGSATPSPGSANFVGPVQPTTIAAGQPVPEGYTSIGNSPDGSQAIAPTSAVQQGSVDWGSVGQGALGAYNLYSAYQDYKQGNMLGAGVHGAYGGALAANTAGGFGSETAGAALPYLGAAAAAYGAYQTDKYVGSMPAGGKRNSNAALQGAAAGAAAGSVVPVIGTGIGALIGGALGFADSYFGSSKDKYQMMRDGGRKVLKENGILDEDYQGTLADGSKFDFGKDGKEAGKLNTSDPNWQEMAARANVIASGEGLSGKAREAMATLYTNAALSNSGGDLNKAIANMNHFAQQRGFNADNVSQQIDKLNEAKQLTPDEYIAFKNGAQTYLPKTGSPASGYAVGSPQTPANPNAQAAAIGARTGTLSPGIGLNGKPLTPQQMKLAISNPNNLGR